jgi:hypothetical protein
LLKVLLVLRVLEDLSVLVDQLALEGRLHLLVLMGQEKLQLWKYEH